MQKAKSKIGLIFVLLVVVFTLTACSSGSNSTGDSSSKKETPTYQLNEDVTVDGKARWKVLEASNLGQELKSTNTYIDSKTTTGKFIKVRFEVENLGTNLASIASLELVDDKGRRFNRYSEDYSFVPEKENYVFENLNPNVPKIYTSIYEVPQDAAGIKFVASDLNAFSGGEALIDLGL